MAFLSLLSHPDVPQVRGRKAKDVSTHVVFIVCVLLCVYRKIFLRMPGGLDTLARLVLSPHEVIRSEPVDDTISVSLQHAISHHTRTQR